jgi:hypothetical protein
MRSPLMSFVGAVVLSGGCAASGGDDGPDPDAPSDLIDNLEDGDDAIDETNGRLGGWYTFHDDTVAGTQIPPETGFTPLAGGADGSSFAAGTSGSGFAEWGAGMGFDLNNPEAVGMTGVRGVYDASGYHSIAFKARGNVPIRVALETLGVTPMENGGTCTPSTVEGMECEDLHGVTLNLTSEWKDYELEFGTLRQEGWGKAVPFAATEVVAVLFQADKDLQFDFAVDDVRFYE